MLEACASPDLRAVLRTLSRRRTSSLILLIGLRGDVLHGCDAVYGGDTLVVSVGVKAPTMFV